MILLPIKREGRTPPPAAAMKGLRQLAGIFGDQSENACAPLKILNQVFKGRTEADRAGLKGRLRYSSPPLGWRENAAGIRGAGQSPVCDTRP